MKEICQVFIDEKVMHHENENGQKKEEINLKAS